MKIIIDLLDGSETIRINGTNYGVAYSTGTYNLPQTYRTVGDLLARLEEALDKPNGLQFTGTLKDIGEKMFLEILGNDVGSLYSNCKPQVGINSSISFTMDELYLDCPIEFMWEKRTPLPLATRVPVYKSVAIPQLFVAKNTLFEDNPNKEINILLVTSNTYASPVDKIDCGNEKIELPDPLPDVHEIDNKEEDGGNEIDDINKIVNDANTGNTRGFKIHADLFHTEKIDYDYFVQLVESDKYDIIHYNGHGYYAKNEKNSNKRGFIFFWKGKDHTPPVAALNAPKLNQILSDKQRIKLVYLSCCQGAATTTTGYLYSFMGLLHAVINSGVPSVIGMRWPITINNSRDLAKYFYRSLFLDPNCKTIEGALARARREAFQNNDQSVWPSPVLIKQD